MKYTFESNNLAIGVLKELLHNFNLPMVDVYTDTPYEGKVYIKGREVVKYSNGKFNRLRDYRYNKPIVNFTTNLPINSSMYDIQTHEYLGDYLRFMRDYNKLDLMSLYNCFGNKQPTLIDYSNQLFIANTSDDLYRYYLVPVRLNKVYTVAIDSDVPYDIVTVIDEHMTSSITDQLVQASIKRVHGSKFTRPFLYSTSFGELGQQLWRNERNLHMLIKLPKRVESSIVILEGDFRYTVVDNTLTTKYLINKDECYALNSFPASYATRLSLLRVDTKISYPFADRLVEYLIGNVICETDDISENVKAIQDTLYETRPFRGNYGLWGKANTLDVDIAAGQRDGTKGYAVSTSHKIIVGDQVRLYTKKFKDYYTDLLYYGDKDIKTLLGLDRKGI